MIARDVKREDVMSGGTNHAAEVAEVRRHYDAGRFVDAHAASLPLGGPAAWGRAALAEGDHAAAVLAGRVAAQVGGSRVGAALHLRAWRAAPGRADVAVYAAYRLLESRGPWAAWRLFKERGDSPGTPVEEGRGEKHAADWLAARAHLRAFFRDFASADADVARAVEMSGDADSWPHVEHSSVLLYQDRYDEALEACHRARAIAPWAQTAVLATARSLQLLGRGDEAMALLREATDNMQSSAAWLAIADLHRERQEAADEAEAVERAFALMPMLDESGDRMLARSLAAKRSDMAYRAGDLKRAAELADTAAGPRGAEGNDVRPADRENKFWRGVADRLHERLKEPDADRYLEGRKQLPVPFVRQHHATCAPATLTSVARFWDRPAEHLEVAEAICYDGTPWHAERDWAEENGWAAREFRLTFDAAAGLIDRGLPFALTTTDAGGGHAQAVIGYDRVRRTLLIRDPTFPSVMEADAASLIERYALWGPRAMALVPPGEEAKLDGADLPDAEVYDRNRAFNKALLRHDRDAAEAALRELRPPDADAADVPPLALFAEATLASYDADAVRELPVVEDILRRFPECEPVLMRRVTLLELQGRDAEARQALEEIAADPQRDPIFAERLASMLAEDARESGRARRLLRRLLRKRPREGSLYVLLGRTLWNEASTEKASDDDPLGPRAMARDAYRFAASIDDKSERAVDLWVSVERYAGAGEAALATLRDRAERYGDKSGGPALTLFAALRDAGRVDEGLKALDAAIERRPDDPDLLLQAAGTRADYGDLGRARELLAQAEPTARRASWLSCAAHVCGAEGDLAGSRDRWREIAEAEPLNLLAHERVAARTEELDGKAAAADYYNGVCERFPRHLRLQGLRYERLRAVDPPAAEAALRAILDADPDDAWALRELAIFLLVHKRATSPAPPTPAELDEAEALIDRAAALDPRHPAGELARSELATFRGDIPAARASARRAVELDADDAFAVARVMRLADTPAEAREAAGFLADLLAKSPTHGDAVPAFAAAATGVLPPADLRAVLADFHGRRPDLWQSWVTLARQHLAEADVESARKLARETTRRFPLLAATWLTLAQVHHAALDRRRQEAALRQAQKVSPDSDAAVLGLVELKADAGDFAGALAALDAALARSPRHSAMLARRAGLLWSSATSEEEGRAAIAAARASLEAEPNQEGLIGALERWHAQFGEDDAAAEFVRTLVDQRPGDTTLRLSLARLLFRPTTAQQCLAELDEVTRLQPREEEAHDLRAELLTHLRRFDDARAACRPAAFVEPPVSLRGREAWVIAESGDLDEARRAMRGVLDDVPAYFWGWRQTAVWSRIKEDLDGFDEATRRMVELAPHAPDSLQWAGHAALAKAERESNDRQRYRREARELFERGLALDPTNAGCGNDLLDLLVKDGELDAAATWLGRLRVHMYPAWALARDAELAAARGDAEAAAAATAAVVVERHPDAGPTSHAISAVREHFAKERRKLRRVRDAACAVIAETNPPAAGTVLAWLGADKEHRRAAKLLKSLEGTDEAWRRAANGYLNATAEVAPGRAADFVRRHRDAILAGRGEAADDLWGTAGYALSIGNRDREVVALMADHAERGDVRPWMFVNLAQSLAALRRHGESLDAARTGLSLSPDHGYERLLIWAAAGEVRADSVDSAAALLSAVTDADALPPQYKALFHAASAVTSADAAADAKSGESAARTHLRLVTTSGHDLRRDRATREFVKFARVRARRRAGGFALLAARVRNGLF